MMRLFLITIFVTMVTGMFAIKNRVAGLEKELAAINAQIESDQGVLQVLKAEWSFLNTPDRIRKLSERHAQMKPIAANQIKGFAAIPFKDATPESGLIRVSYASAAKRE